ncbi:MAG TPA: hypothetical protein VGD98_15365 [Ktedonobacteraceae bacterium]
MLEASSVLIGTKGRIGQISADFVPRLRDVRRVPLRYQRLLPLTVSKSHQCVVLGATSHTLTIGMIECKDERWLAYLRSFTGMAIFPVLVEAGKMRLLIARLERYQRFCQRHSRACYTLQLPSQARVLFLWHESEKI